MVNLATHVARIVLAADAKTWIGATDIQGLVQQPVITDGQMRSWSIKGGCYVLDNIWYTALDGDNVIVNRGNHGCPAFHAVSVGPNVYRIQLRGTNSAWTTGLNPDTPVILAPVGSVEPKYQEFKFVLE